MSEFIERAVDFEPLPEEERGGDAAADGKTLEGYAAVFDSDTEINSWEGHFKERIVRGAFRKTLKERTPVLQFDHGHDSRFGNLPIGNFERIVEDKHGLKVTARLFEHAEPIREAIEAGAVTGMSFRFKVVRDSWTDAKGVEIKDRQELMDLLYGGLADKKRSPLQRTIKEVKLMEAGPVVFPAYPDTTVGVRSMTDDQRKRAIEDLTSGFDPDGAEEREACDGTTNCPCPGNPHAERGEGATTLDSMLTAFGLTPQDVVDAVGRGENPFAKKKDEGDGKSKPKCTCGTKSNDHGKDCPVSKAGKANEKDKKTSSGSKSEKKSEDDTSEVPEAESDAVKPRSEDPNDAAQAGTSTGMTQNARERALRLLEL